MYIIADMNLGTKIDMNNTYETTEDAADRIVQLEGSNTDLRIYWIRQQECDNILKNARKRAGVDDPEQSDNISQEDLIERLREDNRILMDTNNQLHRKLSKFRKIKDIIDKD